MTIPFQKGRFTVRFAASTADVTACQLLRHRCFFGTSGVDIDQFDAHCRHLLVENQTGRLVATVRLFETTSGAQITQGYAAQYYDLSSLAAVQKPMIEIGRFCVAPDVMDADVLRVAWGALTHLVDAGQVAMLFGCTSFAGTDPARYGRTFTRLAANHLGPDTLRPAVKVADVLPFAQISTLGTDPMPPLLRTYLAMGGWVSDHAVIDPKMNTLHIFTCLEVATIPSSRAQALRALAQDASLS